MAQPGDLVIILNIQIIKSNVYNILAEIDGADLAHKGRRPNIINFPLIPQSVICLQSFYLNYCTLQSSGLIGF